MNDEEWGFEQMRRPDSTETEADLGHVVKKARKQVKRKRIIEGGVTVISLLVAVTLVIHVRDQNRQNDLARSRPKILLAVTADGNLLQLNSVTGEKIRTVARGSDFLLRPNKNGTAYDFYIPEEYEGLYFSGPPPAFVDCSNPDKASLSGFIVAVQIDHQLPVAYFSVHAYCGINELWKIDLNTQEKTRLTGSYEPDKPMTTKTDLVVTAKSSLPKNVIRMIEQNNSSTYSCSDGTNDASSKHFLFICSRLINRRQSEHTLKVFDNRGEVQSLSSYKDVISAAW